MSYRLSTSAWAGMTKLIWTMAGAIQSPGSGRPWATGVASFCLLLAMGSALIPTELHGVDPGEWDDLLRRVVAAVAAPKRRESLPSAHTAARR